MLYFHQSFDTTSDMTLTRLTSLYDYAVKREKRPQREVPTETEDERNRRVLLAALRQQEAEQERTRGAKTRYVSMNDG